MRAWWEVLISVLAILIASSAMAQPSSVAELQKLIDAGQYPAAIVAANHLLEQTGDSPKTIDRAAVWMIKGEGHLQTRGFALAADAFAAAAKEEHDAQRAAIDNATEVLIRRSQSGVYTAQLPAADSPKPRQFDILSNADRALAFPVLFNAEWSASEAALKAGKTAQNLDELMPVVQQAKTLRQLELAATHKDVRSRQFLTELADHAYNLLDASVALMNHRVLDINHAALVTLHTEEKVSDSLSRNGQRTVHRLHKTGLTPRNIEELKEIIANCNKVKPAAQALAGEGDTRNSWETIIADSDQAVRRAQDVLETDYGQR